MGAGLAGNVLGMVLGMGMQGHNDDRQVNLQGRLGAQQVETWRRMMGIQSQKELEMWEKTGYKAQVEQMRKAGINPALMYGMGGGGGQSMGGGAPMPSGGNAAGGGGQEMAQFGGMGLQAGMAMAQVELIKAQTEKTKVETAKTGGVDTELAKTSIQSLLQGIKSEGVKQALIGVETELKGLEAKYADKSMSDRLQLISGEAVSAVQRGQQMVNETDISDETKDAVIRRIKAEAVGAVLRNTQTRAQTANTNADTALKGQAYEQNIEKLMIEWADMSIKERKIALELRTEGGDSNVGGQLMEVIDDIIMWRAITHGKKPNTPLKKK